MRQLRRRLEGRINMAGPAFAAFAMAALTMILVACGKGGGSGY
jgi:hypothetical protein